MAGRPLIGTSWKMNFTLAEADTWFRTVLPLVGDLAARELFVLPPYTALPLARERLGGSAVAWGAQDVSPDEDGAHTGDISARMLADLGCRFVMVGHVERRRDHGETADLIARKVAAIARWDMRPILCVGEPARGPLAAVLAGLTADLATCLAGLTPVDATRLVVAYEPAWAIGRGAQSAPVEHVASVHAALHGWLQRWAPGAAVPIIYGGSVAEGEAGRLLALPGVDGLFIGRHALDPRGFAQLAHAGLLAAASEDARPVVA